MKRRLLLIPVLLLTVGNALGQIHKKMTVVSQIIEKTHVPIYETVLEGDMNVVSGSSSQSQTSITKYDFAYNTLGQLTSIKSYLVENGNATDSFTTTMELNENNKLNKVIFGEKKMTLDLVYEKNILQTTEFKDQYYDESRVSEITYNKLDLPGTIEKKSLPQYSDPETTNFIYDPNNNAKLVNLDNNKTTYTYDKKKYPFSFLPYAFNISNDLSPDDLMYTNYIQQNNVVQIDTRELMTTIDYTYNTKDLPITAQVKKLVKLDPSDQASTTYDYEFVYKEIDIVE
ncbi:hypothetical protein LNQ81_03000 [Myroides sp. M-43]|uniref:hypothetical protein n=1 Tax=Myroides oncorhynchi TaxID=2893756 RepID=UPI001E442F08|nr:hypothetical protein [Myroides oncorhynchi]MCC9041671.1 hypothetical protein [Myroides oncorhynchi]